MKYKNKMYFISASCHGNISYFHKILTKTIKENNKNYVDKPNVYFLLN